MAREYWGHHIPETHEERLALGTALIVVDLQRDFVHPDGHCAKSMDVSHIGSVVPANARLISLARQHRIPVICTLVTQHVEGAYASPRWIADNLRYPNFEPIHCIEGTWGWELHDEIATTSSDILLRKYRRSAFVGTNLVDLLHTLRRGNTHRVGCRRNRVCRINGTRRDRTRLLRRRARGLHRRRDTRARAGSVCHLRTPTAARRSHRLDAACRNPPTIESRLRRPRRLPVATARRGATGSRPTDTQARVDTLAEDGSPAPGTNVPNPSP